MEHPRYQTRAFERAQVGLGNDQGLHSEESSGTEAEGRSRRKFRRAATDNDNAAFRKPILPASAMKQNQDAKTNLVRRKSIQRENKPLLGPRPFDSSPGKRIVSDGTAQVPRPPRDLRSSFLPSSASMPVLDNKSKDNRLAFGLLPSARDMQPASTASASYNFLPEVNFDDFHSSIDSYDQGRNVKSTRFPALGPSVNAQPDDLQDDVMSRNALYEKSPRKHIMAQNKNQPVLRQGSGARRDNTIPVKEAITALPQPPAQPMALRYRRQSAAPAPPLGTQPQNKIPRKSVGPGLLSGMLQGQSQTDQTPVNAAVRSNIARTPSLPKTSRRGPLNQDPTLGTEQSRAMMSTRSSRAKSTQPLGKQPTSNHLSEPPVPAEQCTAKSPGRTPNNKSYMQRANTPSSSANKRQSGRMSGLGARTVSPTDAHRLKRISTMQPPPVMRRPSSPEQEPMPEMRSTAKSPSLIPRRTNMTPSSARETPDALAQKYMPQLSLSRSSSYQSLRSISNVGSSRINPSPSFSKLPTPKTRGVYSSADRRDDEELVPPIPAIPKAYQSPSEQVDTPFFSDAKPNSFSQATPPIQTNTYVPSGPVSATPRSAVEPRKPSLEGLDSPRHRRNMTTGAETVAAVPIEKVTPATPMKKKSLQPLRLPPLNLLPISTPTASRIASFPAPSAEVDNRELTPPPRRNLAKTPTTPMTASKATFNRRNDDEPRPAYNLRSSSSHHALRGAADHSALNGFADTVPMPMPLNAKRQITPFSSGSLPRIGGNFGQDERPGPDEYTLSHQDVHLQTSKPMGPRARTVSKSVKDTNSTHTASSNEEPETPHSSTSLRRRFSLNWRRSSSKNANRHAAEQSNDTLPADYPEMPPPRLPASATMSSLPDGNRKTPTEPPRSSFDMNQRRPSQPNLYTDSAQKMSLSGSNGNAGYRALNSNPVQPVSAGTRSSSWSILASNRVPSVRTQPSTTNVKGPVAIPQHLDKDDMVANEEMRRLAAKRKDVESAARETDELKKLATAKQPQSPMQAIQSSASLLNIYEKGEIIDYKDGVYFCGSRSAKKHVGDISAAGTTNFGYDDERGDYNIVMGDHLAYRYEVIDVLGKGSFGQVVRCVDHKLGGLCAVKIIRNKKRFHQQALVEVNILKRLKEWDPDEAHATLTISSSFYFRSHLCIVTPCLSINLYELIRAHSFQGFSVHLIRRFARQMLTCLKLLQDKRIIHCDLKPENILLCDPRRADIRVIDFGSSCKTDEKVYTYIQSRFYRSPEVILGSEYGLGIDMWSFGCILAELYTGYPIFPGENEQEQLACIMEIFGPPSKEIIEKSTRRKLFFDSTLKPRVTVSSKGRRRRPSSKSLQAAIKCDDEAFLDFISQCLRWDPDRRLKPDQAMNHPFITREAVRRMADRPRVRTGTAATGPVAAGGIPSPIKRVQTTTAPVSTSSTMGSTQTPAKDLRSRPLPDTPSTAVRNGVAVKPQQIQPDNATKISPLKPGPRRQSGTVNGAPLSSQPPSLAVAGSKRASNGLLLQQQQSYGSASGTALPRVGSGRLGMGVDMAGAAARQSMGVSSERSR
ncbi:hypothetical protein MBLNU457_6670t1 [Dothideomycetes sp. NU457]